MWRTIVPGVGVAAAPGSCCCSHTPLAAGPPGRLPDPGSAHQWARGGERRVRQWVGVRLRVLTEHGVRGVRTAHAAWLQCARICCAVEIACQSIGGWSRRSFHCGPPSCCARCRAGGAGCLSGTVSLLLQALWTVRLHSAATAFFGPPCFAAFLDQKPHNYE